MMLDGVGKIMLHDAIGKMMILDGGVGNYDNDNRWGC